MRRYILRFDIWLTMLVAYGLAAGAGKLVDLIVPVPDYEAYVEEHAVPAGEIGGEAGDDVFAAQSVEDLLSHDTFTILSEGIAYRNEGGGYFGGKFLYNVALPSGERVAASINTQNVVKPNGDDYYVGLSRLPVGRVVYADLSEDDYFMEQISYRHEEQALTRTDFYVDMVGDGMVMDQESYESNSYKVILQAAVFIIVFPLFHSFGAKFGIFPYFLPPRNRKKSEWD